MSNTGIPASWLDLEQARRKEEIVRLTAQQVVKDFATFGLEIQFSGDTQSAYEELYHQLAAHLKVLLDTDFSKLKALLYQIDVSEKKQRKAISDGRPYHEALAEQILDREFIKVLTRLYFRDNSAK